MNRNCAYCNQKGKVKIWLETNEYVCLPCRMSLLAQEFEKTADKEECGLLLYWSRLLDPENDRSEVNESEEAIL